MDLSTLGLFRKWLRMCASVSASNIRSEDIRFPDEVIETGPDFSMTIDNKR